MFRFVVVVLSLLLVLSVVDMGASLSSTADTDDTDTADTDTQDPDLDDTEDRIVSGSATNIALHPYQISLQTQKGAHMCGGSIISTTKVLTAAHCVKGETPASLRIRAGSAIWKQYGVLRNISAIRIHPDYKAATHESDLAVLTLSKALVFGDKINKVTIATETPASGEVGIATGWGTLYEGASGLPLRLQAVALKFIRNAICSVSPYKYTNSEIRDGMICAAASGKDTCQGDSGGPLISKTSRKLVGVTSWGNGCAETGYPGVYTNAVIFRQFILSSL